MGKSTFAQALAEFYSKQDKIVKTVEAPRDLVLPENVTQYALSHGDAQEIHDISERLQAIETQIESLKGEIGEYNGT